QLPALFASEPGREADATSVSHGRADSEYGQTDEPRRASKNPVARSPPRPLERCIEPVRGPEEGRNRCNVVALACSDGAQNEPRRWDVSDRLIEFPTLRDTPEQSGIRRTRYLSEARVDPCLRHADPRAGAHLSAPADDTRRDTGARRSSPESSLTIGPEMP